MYIEKKKKKSRRRATIVMFKSFLKCCEHYIYAAQTFAF